MAQRHDIINITFQANARGANAAIESLRVKAEECDAKVTKLRKDLKEGVKMGKSTEELDKIRTDISAAEKETRQWSKAYKELIKGMSVLDQGIKAFNDGSLAQMSAAFQKTLYNAAKLTRTKLAPDSKTFREDFKQLTAIMDAAQQNFARLQGDAQTMLNTLRNGGKVSTAALNEELKAQRELLSVMSESDKGYKQTQRDVAELDLYLRRMGGGYEFVRQNITDTKKVSDDMLRNMYKELEQVNAEGKVTRDTLQANKAAMQEIRNEQARRVENVLGGNLGQQSEQSIRSQISVAKELLSTYKTNSKEAQTLSAQIVNAEEHLKTHGVEAARVAQREAQQIKTQEDAEKQLQTTMKKRLTTLKSLSVDALAETRKYWEAQRNGAESGSTAFKKAEDALRRIDNLERNRKVAQLDTVLADPKKFGVAEVRNATQEMERLRDSVQQGIPQWQHYNKMVEQGKAYLDNLAKTEAAQKIASQMQNLTTLSAQGLAETKRYWETMVAGAAHGSAELTAHETKLKEVTAEEQRRAELQAQSKVGILSSGSLGAYSEAEIRKAIEAGQQLIQTYKTADPEAKKLAQNIVAAEQHLKQYGLEAERTAQRERDALAKAADERRKNDALMKQQLQQGGALLSESALKAQQQYWQRLIDDPKTAAESLREYKQRLQEVQSAQRGQVDIAGMEALTFFRGDTSNASADQIKQQTDALKRYRDSLPQEANAEIIAEINSYITKTGEAAKVAAGEMMSLSDAEALAGKLGTKGFTASTDKLTMAKKALEDAQIAADRGSVRFTELQDKINKVDIELAKTGEIAKSVQDTLDQPKGKGINELKQAVEQGRVALYAMDRSTEEGQKQFDELAKKIKNADFELKRLTGTAKGSATAFDKAWSRLKTYIGLYVGAAVAMQKIVATMGDLMELSDKMGEVRKTTGFTADEVGRLSDNLKKLDVRTSLTSLMELSSLAGSVGLKTQEDVQGFTEAANQLMIALPEMGNESARTLIKIAQATGDLKKNNNDVRETLEKVGSTIIALRANSASAAGPITDFVSRVGAVGAQSGISIDQIAALGSTIDALGGRVEMSATALSRMIPAIKNNSFAVANSIGVTESYLKSLSAMDQMVLIFEKLRDSIQGINTETEEGQQQMADNVEAVLGKNAVMAEVMKDLNQQGARAGIVFGLLSQNVDELQRQLGIAGNAYEKNMALQEEFNKMNDTTAAKWERLKNTFEEMFVSDSMQRRLGWIIDRLKDLVDFIAEDGPIVKGLKVITTYAIAMKIQLGATFASMGGAFKNFATMVMSGVNVFATALGNVVNVVTGATHSMRGLRAATIGARKEWLAMDATMKANLWGAIIAAIGMLAYKLWEVHKAAMEAAAEVGRFNQKLGDEKKALDDLFTPLEKSNLAQDERSRLITEINSKYSKYLGYMLTETNSAIQLADAHALVAKRLREEAYEKRILEQEGTVQKKYEKDISSGYGRLVETVRKYAPEGVDVNEVADYLNSVIQSNSNLLAESPGMGKTAWTPEFGVQWNAAVNRMIQSGKLRNVQGMKSDLNIMTNSYLKAVKQQEEEIASATAATRSDLRNLQRSIKSEAQNNLASLVDDVKNYFGKTVTETADATAQAVSDATPKYVAAPTKKNNIGKNWQWQAGGTTFEAQVTTSTKKETKQVQEVGEWEPKVNKKDLDQVKRFVEKQDQLRGYLQQNGSVIDESQRTLAEAYLISEKELEKLRELLPKSKDSNNPNTTTNPYGDFNRVTDSYEKWDADSLVSRRKEMLERVRALANGADVQAVLSEDAKFITEATRKNIKTTRDAIEWYNTERLKIQDALHEKHLTNTGDWMDPTKRKGREKSLKSEWKAYLDELDAYYTARKTKIQDARNDEMITEAEAWRRTLQNDTEWRQRRAELQQLYANKSAKVTAEETEAIYEILAEQTGESSDYIKKDIAQTVKFILAIGEKSKDEMEKLIGQLDKGTEQDFFRQRVAIGKQMDAIADIIEKERPFNGITKNLEENLTKIGVLQADFEKKRLELVKKREDTSELDTAWEAEAPKRVSFLLEEAEHAYNTTIGDVVERMEKKGMTTWAEEIKNDPTMQEAMMGQLQSTFDKIQEAIKKEASLWKKEAENMWNNILMPDGKTTLKQVADQVTAQLSLDANRTGRANSLIGAGQASERVVDKLAIQQMKVELAMQQHYYNLMRERGQASIKNLERQAALAKERGDIEEATRKELDAQHARMTLNLATTKEQTELAKQQEEIVARTEESQNRLYKELKSWAEMIGASLQSVFEASHAGDKEYYNERAKLDLTGKGGPGAGTYIIIDNEGTSDAKAHYEYLDEREALERQREIERQNALAEAWRKVMDDINMKMSETITDQVNAMMQNQSIDANTQAVIKNTEALAGMTSALGEKGGGVNIPSLAGAGNLLNGAIPTGEGGEKNETGVESGAKKTPIIEVEPLQNMEWEGSNGFSSTSPYINPNQEGADFWQWEGAAEAAAASAASQVDSINKVQTALDYQFHQQLQGTKDTNDAIKKSTQSTFAAMTQAANLYGVAYQAMSNDNLDTSQKFQMIALQAAGNAAISGLTAALAQDTAETTSSMPAILAKCLKISPIWGSVLFGALTATLGGLMGLATSKIAKSKSTIAQVTGASASAGRLATGMLTYAEGNVNEFSDPKSLTPGRMYDVDAADGHTYRARYMGDKPRTHLTNGPEFHLSGEKGREMIIDAGTTRQITMNEGEIWRAIQTLSGGGRLRHSVRRGRGMANFADGNVEEFEEMENGSGVTVNGSGFSLGMMTQMQASLDRNSEVLERALREGFKGVFDVYGKGGLVDSYDTGKRTVNRYGERY